MSAQSPETAQAAPKGRGRGGPRSRSRNTRHETSFTETYPEMAHRVVLKRAREWRASHQPELAIDALRKLARIVDPQHPVAREVARELMACGDFAGVDALLPALAGEPGLRVDAAMRIGKSAAQHLDASLRPSLESAIDAFTAFEAGDDDRARALLDSIGIASPLIEWKVMLRGLMAWQARDSSRAADNWSRLKSDRLPRALILPLWQQIDPAVGGTDAPRLVAARKTLLAAPILDSLIELQRLIFSDKGAQIHRLIREIAAGLKKDWPQLLPRLTEVAGLILQRRKDLAGVNQIAKFLPPLPYDPTFDFMRSIAAEDPADRIKYTLAYDRVIAARSELWGDRTAAVRAKLLYELASDGWYAMDFGPDPLAFIVESFIALIGPLVEKAVILKPDFVDAWHLKLEMASVSRNGPEIARASREIQRIAPEDPVTWRVLARVQREQGDLETSLESTRREIDLQPLARDHATRKSWVHRRLAVVRWKRKEWDDAERLTNIAAELDPNRSLGLQVALFTRLQQTDRVDALLASDFARGLDPNALAIRVLVYGIDPPTRKALKARWTVAPSAAPQAGSLRQFAQVVDAFADADRDELTYSGMKTTLKHFQKILLDRVATVTAQDLDDRVLLCRSLAAARWYRGLGDAAVAALCRFHDDPRFLYFELRAEIGEQRGRSKTSVSTRIRRIRAILDRSDDSRFAWVGPALDDMTPPTRPIMRKEF